MEIEKRLIVISCLHFVVGPVVIDPVILVKCTFHRLSVALFAQLNWEIGQSSNNTWLNICAACPMDLEIPACRKRNSAEVLQGQGRRAVREAVAEGRSEKCSPPSLVNAATLRDLTATVFKTYLVPSSENVAEAMAEAGRLYHDSAGAIKNKPEAERTDAQDQLSLPFVHVWVAFLRSLAATKELGTEHVAALRQYWESNVVKSESVQLAAHFRHCRAKPCRKIEGKEGWMHIVFCLDLVTLLFEEALEAALRLQKGVRKHGPAPRGALEREAPRTRRGEALDADGREVERLARPVEQHSQRMAELLRRGVKSLRWRTVS